MSQMRQLDEHEKKIITELIKDPRISDNQIGKNTKVPIRTVNRKRKILEEQGFLNYYTQLNMGNDGTGRFGARQLHIIKFRLGIPRSQIIKEIKEEKNVKNAYTRTIYESHIAEIDGHVALVMILEGKGDDDIVEEFNKVIVPALRKNHGDDAILEIQTIRLSDSIRIFHNYIPMINMEKGKLKKDWPNQLIFLE